MANPERAIQDCLDRLNIGYVDMMLLHHPDRNDVMKINFVLIYYVCVDTE